jgi:hypothetical protein
VQLVVTVAADRPRRVGQPDGARHVDGAVVVRALRVRPRPARRQVRPACSGDNKLASSGHIRNRPRCAHGT